MRKDAENHFHCALDLVPGLRDTVASGRREARFTGTGDLPNLYRTSAGPGWALAGDAGHHKDPSTGMGMSDAFQAAELLAEAIHDGLAEHRPLDQAVSGYQNRRDVLTGGGFDLTLSTARLAPLQPRLEAFYRTAAQQPELSRQIFGVLGGSLTTKAYIRTGASRQPPHGAHADNACSGHGRPRDRIGPGRHIPAHRARASHRADAAPSTAADLQRRATAATASSGPGCQRYGLFHRCTDDGVNSCFLEEHGEIPRSGQSKVAGLAAELET